MNDGKSEFNDVFLDRLAEEAKDFEDFDDDDSDDDFDDFDDSDDDEIVSPENNYEEGTPQHVLSQSIEGEHLIKEWGSDFNANMEHAEHALEYASQNAPEFIKALDTPVEREDGSTYTPGDDPQWLRLAAEFGRLQMHRDGIESDFEANRPATEDYGLEENDSIIRERLDELYGLINTEEYKHPKIQKEIKDLEKAIGDKPAVGSGGRYA